MKFAACADVQQRTQVVGTDEFSMDYAVYTADRLCARTGSTDGIGRIRCRFASMSGSWVRADLSQRVKGWRESKCTTGFCEFKKNLRGFLILGPRKRFVPRRGQSVGPIQRSAGSEAGTGELDASMK
jgi:hypothetical protein